MPTDYPSRPLAATKEDGKLMKIKCCNKNKKLKDCSTEVTEHSLVTYSPKSPMTNDKLTALYTLLLTY